MFELSLLELLKRNVDVDDIDSPLPRDLEKYIVAYQMCKTPEMKYMLAIQNEHNHIAKYYSSLPTDELEKREHAHLLSISYQIENNLPYDNKLMKRLLEDGIHNLSRRDVLECIVDAAAKSGNTDLFLRVWRLGGEEFNLYRCVKLAAKANSADILMFLLPYVEEQVLDSILEIVYLTDTEVIDQVLSSDVFKNQEELSIDDLLIQAESLEDTSVFANHLREHYL